ncbi:uncharacterized protein LOC126743064 [Anthonomus grandis grandis]|uniref:uncharacterized protein LOC126743064 n=1 Tax=Anthonomus grandis grandis TaxID=2921223 RepID=UPI00216633D7|nr:uncharacterized protein LOC126743064 [Anthonomus grandis grandis]
MSLEKAKSIEAGLQTVIGTTEDSPSDKPLFARLKFIFSNMTIEPVLVLYILPSIMVTIAVQNLNLEKACRVNLGISTEHCDAITVRNESAYPDYKADEERVQTLAAYMTILKNTVQSIFPAIILLFLGSWSDRFQKRKLCMLVPVLGDMTSVTGLIICTYFFHQLPMEVNSVCESLFPAISGTWFAMFCGVYSYISDVSSEEERTVRIGAINLLANVSMCIGTALSGVLYKSIGFYGVFGTALGMYSVSLGYGYFFVRDTCKMAKEGGSVVVKSEGFFRDFFQIDHIKETFKTAVKSDSKKRGRKTRVCAIMFLFAVIVGPLYGELNVVYFFVRFRFGWDAIEYSFFATFQFVTNTLGTMFSLAFFSKFLQLDDSILGIISCSTKILASGVYAFAPGPVYYYLGAVVEILNGTSFIAMRAMITKLVSAEELGKINSLFGMFEAVVPLVYGPLYSRIYAATIDYFPGCFYLVGGGLTCPALFIFYWLYLQHKEDLRQAIVEEVQEEKLLHNQLNNVNTIVNELNDKL